MSANPDQDNLPFALADLGNTYVDLKNRFIVSLIVGYGPEDGVTSPEAALAAALELTRDLDSSSTQWYVHDRETGVLHLIEQGAVAGVPVS